MNRGALVTALWRLKGEPVGSGSSFADVDGEAWYAASVSWAAGTGLVSGVGGGLFAPERGITRAEMAAVLYRMMDQPRVDRDLSGYADAGQIPGWAADALAWCVENGLMNGKAGQRLAPNDTATRAELAVILQRFTLHKGQRDG